MVSHVFWRGGLVLLLGLSTTIVLALSGSGGSGSEPPPPPSNTEFAGILLRAGFSGEALAASGVNAQQVTALASAVEGQYNAATLLGLDEAYASARTTRDRLSRLVRGGTGSAEDVSALAQAEATLTSATNARANYVNGLRSAGLATLPAERVLTLQTIHQNQSWGLPTPYLVKNRSQSDWVALRDALATQRISVKAGEQVPDATQSYLAAVDGEVEIAAASVSLETNIAAIQTAWNAAAAD